MLKIKGSTGVYGLIGDPVEHSRSPAMHNAAFQHLGLDCVYIPFPVKGETLGEALAGLKALQVRGVNVTAPHKEAVLPYLDWLSPDASFIGAVNTVRQEGGRLSGFNTDGAGFTRYLRDDLKIEIGGRKALILGAGGSARSLAYRLCREGLGGLVLANRSPGKALRLARELREQTGVPVVGMALGDGDLGEAMQACHVFIYTLPGDVIDGAGGEGIITLDPLGPGTPVFDLRYSPWETPLLQLARGKGHPAYNGAGMLLHQGALAFKIFTGLEPPLGVMEAAVFSGEPGSQG